MRRICVFCGSRPGVNPAYRAAAESLGKTFAERVQASIVVQRQATLPDDLGTVHLAGRREPVTNGAISWQAEGLGRCDLNDPRVNTLVRELLAELQAELD